MTGPSRHRSTLTTLVAVVVLVGSLRTISAGDAVPAADPAIAAIRLAIDGENFVEARTAIDALRAAHPSPDPALAASIGDLVAAFGEKRALYFRTLVRGAFVRSLERLTRDRMAVDGITFNDAQAWMRKEAIEVAFASVSLEFRGKDAWVLPEEVRAWFESRPKTQFNWRTASYGSGSFLVKPGALAAPSRDAWWAKAGVEARAGYFVAHLIEASGLFEIDPKYEAPKCRLCLGEGRITKRMSNGTALTYVCPRCSGLGSDQVVRYR